MSPIKKPFAAETDRDRAYFNTTHWSLIAQTANEDGSESAAALEELCRNYWPPIYAEIRRRGHAQADAKDLTQEFFARLLRRNAFGRAEKDKGRFRSYLLAALDFFLADEWREKMAEKRGGGVVPLPLDSDVGESWYREQPACGSTPEEAFDQHWAVVLMDRALEALRGEYHATGRGEVFQAVEPFLTADSGTDGYEDVCGQIGLSSQAFAVAVHRVRRRFRACVREQVEMTVLDTAEADVEMKHLFGI